MTMKSTIYRAAVTQQEDFINALVARKGFTKRQGADLKAGFADGVGTILNQLGPIVTLAMFLKWMET